MKKTLIALCLTTAMLASACGGGDGGGDTAGDDRPATTAGDGTARTPDVEAAEEGRVNVPEEGTYVYEYSSEQQNASTPDATPRRSKEGAELRREVSVSDDVITTADRTSEGSAVATVKRKIEEDGVYELSFETKTDQGTSGCTFSEPIRMIPIPLAEGELDAQPLEGEGGSCDGERTITVEGREETEDAEGVTWTTWRIEVETVVRGEGITNRSTDTRWFSPDLGTDIRVEGLAEFVNPEGDTVARASSTSVLKSRPA